MKIKKRKRLIIYSVCIIILIFGGVEIFHKGNNRDINSKEKFVNVKLNSEIPSDVYKSKHRYIKDLIKEDSNKEVHAILANLSKYPVELVELASYDKEALNFVYEYPFEAKYYQNKKIEITNYKNGEIPLFIQWDKEWGYDKYGDNYIAVNGCGPTALAMVVVGLTGDTSINPKVIADYAYKNGYYVNGYGTKWEMMTGVSKHFGVEGTQIPLVKSIILKDLKEGKPIIAAMGPGVFTKTGHYVVLTGVTSDGRIKVNDPNSVENSSKTWPISIFMKETRDLWVFKKS